MDAHGVNEMNSTQDVTEVWSSTLDSKQNDINDNEIKRNDIITTCLILCRVKSSLFV